MKRGKIHWITQNIKVGIETRKLIRYPLFMRRKELLPLAFGGRVANCLYEPGAGL